MARTRSAHHTIAGYHYQFDKSLIEILKAESGRTITLEGIEDIDLSTETIQCKYHASQRYVPSILKSPLLAFLTHFVSENASLTYTLYAHFKEGELPSSLTTEEIKSILGSDFTALSITEADVALFVQDRLRFVPAHDIDDQHEEALALLCSVLQCDRQEAIDYFYGNSLHEIIRLSRQPTINDRQTTRQQFLAIVNRKRRLFSIWLAQLKGEADYIRYVRTSLRQQDAISPAKHKLFMLGKRLTSQCGLPGLVILFQFLVDRFYRLEHVLWDAVPPTVILDCDESLLMELKRALLRQHVIINDGHEHLEFQPWLFDLQPIKTFCVTRNGHPTDKVKHASYVLRLIGRKTYIKNKAMMQSPHITFVIGSDTDDIDVDSADTLHLHAVENHTSLMAILR